MKKSRGLFYAGLGGIVVVLVIAVVVIVTSRGASPGGTSSAPGGDVVTLTCLGGSEKEDLMADPEVKKILRDKYRIEVDFNATGSYKQVQIPTDELKANKIDCLWPSSASAQAIFEGSGNNKAFGNDYRAESVLQSPEVLYANKEAAEGSEKYWNRAGTRQRVFHRRLQKALGGLYAQEQIVGRRGRFTSCGTIVD